MTFHARDGCSGARAVPAAVECPRSHVRVRSEAASAECAALKKSGSTAVTSRVPDDDWILSLAVSSASDCIGTDDDDLLSLGSFRDIEMLRPSDFWEFEIAMSGDA